MTSKLWGHDGAFNWWRLRPVGNLKALKVSYAVLFLAPLLSQYDSIARYLGISTGVVTASFFASLFLALANLLYDVFCPTIIKRFDSPNDLYHEMLTIKEKSAALYPADRFDASRAHCMRAYNVMSGDRAGWGMTCAALYLASACFFAGIMLSRVRIVACDLIETCSPP